MAVDAKRVGTLADVDIADDKVVADVGLGQWGIRIALRAIRTEAQRWISARSFQGSARRLKVASAGCGSWSLIVHSTNSRKLPSITPGINAHWFDVPGVAPG